MVKLDKDKEYRVLHVDDDRIIIEEFDGMLPGRMFSIKAVHDSADQPELEVTQLVEKR
jgi:hypothetical protein